MAKSDLKIIFFGTPDFVVPILDTLHENFNLMAVVTAPDQKTGRKQILTPSPIKLASQGLSLQGWNGQIMTSINFDNSIIDQLRELAPDLFIVAAYGKIIPPQVLDIPKFGSLNIHPSLLPKYRGASPIQSAILNGDKTTGITVIAMDEKMDHGPVVFTKEIELSIKDNLQTLSKKMFLDICPNLALIIEDFTTGKIEPQGQDDARATYCPIIKKEDGYFDITNPPSLEKLDRMIRAFYPWPTAWTRWEGKIIKFLPQGMVQMEGKRAVKLEGFLRGCPQFPFKSLN